MAVCRLLSLLWKVPTMTGVERTETPRFSSVVARPNVFSVELLENGDTVSSCTVWVGVLGGNGDIAAVPSLTLTTACRYHSRTRDITEA